MIHPERINSPLIGHVWCQYFHFIISYEIYTGCNGAFLNAPIKHGDQESLSAPGGASGRGHGIFVITCLYKQPGKQIDNQTE